MLEVHGLDYCPDHGIYGFKRYVSLAIVGRNLQRIGAILQGRDRKRIQKNRKRYSNIQYGHLRKKIGCVNIPNTASKRAKNKIGGSLHLKFNKKCKSYSIYYEKYFFQLFLI
jgi:hypothetical protein